MKVSNPYYKVAKRAFIGVIVLSLMELILIVLFNYVFGGGEIGFNFGYLILLAEIIKWLIPMLLLTAILFLAIGRIDSRRNR